MIDDEKPAGVGHNAIDLRAGAVADLKEALARFKERKAQFLKAAANAKVKNRATAGDAADLVRLARDVWDLIDIERTTRSRPYREAADALKATADGFWADVDEAMRLVRLDIDEWTAEEDARIEAQQREQNEQMSLLRKRAPTFAPPVVLQPGDAIPEGYVELKFEHPVDSALADARVHFVAEADTRGSETIQPPRPRGPAPAPKRRDIRGDLGGKVIAADVRTYTVTNLRELPDWVIESDAVAAAIQTVLRQSGKHMKVIPGVEIGSAKTNRIG